MQIITPADGCEPNRTLNPCVETTRLTFEKIVVMNE